MPTMSMICHACAQEFLSDVPLDGPGAGSSLVEGQVFECPYCGIRDPYFSSDYRGRPNQMRGPESKESGDRAPHGPPEILRGK
jgi:DNA-directed RNA polymerase subunit RPC12/RpoP